MRASKILLLLCILAFGGFIETAHFARGQMDIGPTGCRVLAGRYYGPSFTFETEQTQAVSAGTGLDVQNAFGSVHVSRGTAGEVRAKLRTVVYRPTEAEARAFSDGVRLEVAASGTTLRVSTNRDAAERGDGRVGFETHLDLAVPADTPVTVRNEHGAVDVADVAAADVWTSNDSIRLARVAGPAVVKGQHGQVWVSGVQGALSLTNRHGDVEVEDVADRVTVDAQHGTITVRRTGALKIESAYGDVEVVTVRGALDLKSAHARVQVREVAQGAVVENSFGDVDVEQVTGEARTRVEHGRLTVRDVKGPLFARATFNDVLLERIAGPVEVSVEHGGVQAESLESGGRIEAIGNEVVVDGFRGPLAVQTQRAGVRLVPAGPLQSPLTVTATHGGIHLQVPAGSRFDLEAVARRGELSANVPGLTLTSSEASTHVSGQLGGGGARVQLTAENGEIRLEPRVEVVEQQPPSPPTHP